MNREDLRELHYITPISNMASIMSHGILSHKRAKRIQHDSISMPQIQDRRSRKIIPGGRPLHEYVNLYINARNKMLFKIKEQHANICVLRISTDVLDLPGVVVTDQNASSGYARFASAPDGIRIVDCDLVFTEYWTHTDQIEKWRHGSIICAEVLVPDRVDSSYIIGAYVSCDYAKMAFESVATGIPIIINSHLFFR